MICNIIDSRARPFRWREVDAIIEATSHDNTVADSDQVPPGDSDLTFDCLVYVSVNEAIAWANGQQCAVTLYLYDAGQTDGEGESEREARR